MRDLVRLLEPGTLVSEAWAAVYGPPSAPGWTFARVPGGWRAERVSRPKMFLDRVAPVIQYRRTAA